MGVWIETAGVAESAPSAESHPSWVCGLKQNDLQKANVAKTSHPSWVCGLKQSSAALMQGRAGHTLRGCVD